MSFRKIVPLLLAALLAASWLSGCGPKQPTTAEKLMGTWYEGQTGAQYQFLTDSVLVVPHAQANGGNAVMYKLLQGDRLDIDAGASHHVSMIQTLTPQVLALADPLSGTVQPFYRDVTKTAFMRSIASRAASAAAQIETMTVDPTIVWVAPKPEGKGAEWTAWSPMTLNGYGQAWDWGALKRDSSPVAMAGGGDSAGYSFSFTRKVPTSQALKGLAADTSIEAIPGKGHIDVGYSASKANYRAGTVVYLPGGLILCLGDGFAVGIDVDKKTETFVPRTHD